MKAILFFLFLLTSMLLCADQTVRTKIEAVTIYKNGAMIQREAKVKLTKGKNDLKFIDLPLTINENSLIFDCKNKVNTDIIDFYIEKQKKDEIKNDESTIKKIKDISEKKLEILRKIELVRERKNHYEKLRSSFLSGLNNSAESLLFKDVQLFTEKYFSGIDKANRDIEGLRKEFSVMDEETDRLKKSALEKAPVDTAKTFQEVNSVVETDSDLETLFTIKYFMPNCSWKTDYNGYFYTREDNNSVECVATILQNTAENWNETQITLSEDKMNLKEETVQKTIDTQVYQTGGTTGKIKGVVKDEGGDPLPGAYILIEGTTLGAQTDENGYYYIIGVRAGIYNLKCQFIGYKSALKQGVQVKAGLTTAVDFNMISGDVMLKEISFSAAGSGITKSKTTSTRQIKSESISVESVNDIASVLSSQAGVKKDAGGALHFRGGRSGEVEYIVDGISVGDPTASGRRSVEKIQTLADNISTFAPSNINRLKHTSTYELPGKYTVENNKEAKLNVFKNRFESEKILTALPNISNKLYSSEKVKNNTGLTLFPGRFNIYLDDSYIGQKDINTLYPGDSLQLNFGQVRKIKLKREVTEESTIQTKFFSDKKVLNCKFITEFTNVDDLDRTIEMIDPLPVSLDRENISVALKDSLKWNLSAKGFVKTKFKLKKNENKKINMEYQISYPKNDQTIKF